MKMLLFAPRTQALKLTHKTQIPDNQHKQYDIYLVVKAES